MKIIYSKVLVLTVVLIMSTYFVSAGVGEWFKGITGWATSGGANATVTLTGSNNISLIIYNYTIVGENRTPVEDSYVTVTFTIGITDADGVSDINGSSLYINVSRAGEALSKTNNSCGALGGQSTATSQNYSCTFTMWYFEEAAAWTINATANDYGTNIYVSNLSAFTYQSLAAFQIAPTSLTWAGMSPAQANQTSNNDPIVANNTGNFNFTYMNITGQALIGQTSNTYYLAVANFTISNVTGSNAECFVTNQGARLVNGSSVNINQSLLTRGNHTSNNGVAGQEQYYFCIPLVPSNLQSQSYTTTKEWTITGA